MAERYVFYYGVQILKSEFLVHDLRLIVALCPESFELHWSDNGNHSTSDMAIEASLCVKPLFSPKSIAILSKQFAKVIAPYLHKEQQEQQQLQPAPLPPLKSPQQVKRKRMREEEEEVQLPAAKRIKLEATTTPATSNMSVLTAATLQKLAHSQNQQALLAQINQQHEANRLHQHAISCASMIHALSIEQRRTSWPYPLFIQLLRERDALLRTKQALEQQLNLLLKLVPEWCQLLSLDADNNTTTTTSCNNKVFQIQRNTAIKWSTVLHKLEQITD